MVYRVYSKKKPELAGEAKSLLSDARSLLGVRGLTDVEIYNRYDAEDIDPDLFEYAKRTVFSEPPVDILTDAPDFGSARVFAVEYLPGQFDQRADSAAQCIQIISRGERPLIRSAKVYVLHGTPDDEAVEKIKRYVINPVEAREASLEVPDTLRVAYETPADVKTVEGFTKLDRAGLEAFVSEWGLAMDTDDALFCRDAFLEEGRDPTVTEIRMIDTYWSDHCRHTTFGTQLDSVEFDDPAAGRAWRRYLDARVELGREDRPVCLMDLATTASKLLRKRGQLPGLDESEEINACTVRIKVTRDGKPEDWLLLFKNETHNHPTEIEPFGGAATCIGGAIRDPLSGRAYVYGAMRITGAADPLKPVSETIPGKLPQRKIVTGAAAGYSSYGNQIGLATGVVDELYHPGYAAKRMEIGAVIAAAPAENVRRERPAPGDVVILLGGATGRDGCGGATGSSKSHTAHSLETCGAEVQKGNAPEERKLQRLFRRKEAARLIKRCNDFGAGGVSVAIGELADGLSIDLDAVPKKYEGLDGTELAISESQERMAVVVAPSDAGRFLELAAEENLAATPVATVTEEPRLRMRWRDRVIVDIGRDFLNSNGAEKHASARIAAPDLSQDNVAGSFGDNLRRMAADLRFCSRRGLAERFDSTIGAGTVLMPFGGVRQLTPAQAMVQKISMEEGHTGDASYMSWGYDPYATEKSPFRGAYLAVVSSVCKLIASGAAFRDVYLTFQEYFERLGKDPSRWGKPTAALLGAFEAQMRLGIAAIGGKDSMSGSFEDLDVPPTLVSFAVSVGRAADAVSPEYKKAGNRVWLLSPDTDENGLPDAESLKKLFEKVHSLLHGGEAVSCWAAGSGGAAEAVMKCAMGNGFGFVFDGDLSVEKLFSDRTGSFLIESAGPVPGAVPVGTVSSSPSFVFEEETIALQEIESLYEGKLEPVYPVRAESVRGTVETVSCPSTGRAAPAVKRERPLFLIPAFPGTNCEYDTARAIRDAGGEAKIAVIRNRSADDIRESVEEFARLLRDAQVIFIPGGFSGGDEPEGSGKFITAFFRNEAIRDGVTDLLDRRDGLMAGICNGFQALVKLGLLPTGRITDTDETSPTLTFNTIGRHQSRIVRTRVASDKSPWLAETRVGEIFSVPISHGEGRFLADDALIRRLAENGQIATQYVNEAGLASADVRYNPNGSSWAVEGITSPDGRVFGKMGHSERIGEDLYRNVPGRYDIGMFRSAVAYFK